MRLISPVWQRETPKAGRPCHPGAAEAVASFLSGEGKPREPAATNPIDRFVGVMSPGRAD